MIIYAVSFTDQGRLTGEKLCAALSSTSAGASRVPAGVQSGSSVPLVLLIWRKEEETLHDFTERAFHYHLPLLFIGAAGIAVRTIAPFVQDKMTDSPVLVMDDEGHYVIPILSGHLGGANDLAVLLADAVGGAPVLTTASDVHHCFSGDVFARRNGLAIRNRSGIRMVADKTLKGENITIAVDRSIQVFADDIPTGVTLIQTSGESGHSDADVVVSMQKPMGDRWLLWLSPKTVVIGMGCRRGKSFEELNSFLLSELNTFIHESKSVPSEEFNSLCLNDEPGLDTEGFIKKHVRAVGTIDRKADEAGLQMLAQYWHLPLLTFTAEELEGTPGNFAESDFVRETVGVSNVCERAAVRAAMGPGHSQARLTVRRKANEGMTFAMAEGVPFIQTFNTGATGET